MMPNSDTSNQPRMVTVGSGGAQLTVHELQSIYNELTGKRETISLNFSKYFKVTKGDIENLHGRISQACESYGAEISSGSVTVYHVNGMKEVFSGFDRFKIYNESITSPVENVSLEYNLLIIPAGTTHAKQYKIRILLPSRVGLREKQPTSFVGPVNIFEMLSNFGGKVLIEYVDYSAARHFLTQIEEWYEALDFTPERKFLRTIQGASHLIRSFLPVIFLLVYIMLVPGILKSLGVEGGIGEFGIQLASIIVTIGILAWTVGSVTGRIIERAVDRYQPISYVKLNKGDQRAINNWATGNIQSLVMTVFGVIVALTSKVWVSLISTVILTWFTK